MSIAFARALSEARHQREDLRSAVKNLLEWKDLTNLSNFLLDPLLKVYYSSNRLIFFTEGSNFRIIEYNKKDSAFFEREVIGSLPTISSFCIPYNTYYFAKVQVDIILRELGVLPKIEKKPKTPSSFWLNISKVLFSPKTQKDIFELTAFDWDEEYFEALFKKEVWKARWINVSYTYAFVAAMWQKSPIGDLIEFVKKIAS